MIRRTVKKVKDRVFPPDDSPLRRGENLDFVFIHINKTGGTSIAHAAGLPHKRHLTARQVIDMIGKDAWDSAYKFSVVRNPWDKVLSHYLYRVKTNQTGLGRQRLSFPQWVQATYGREKDFHYYDITKMFQPHVGWLRDFQGEIRMNRVIRFERLSEGFLEVAREVGINSSFPHLNRSEERDYRTFYDTATIEIVRRWFQADLEMFGYSFDE